MKNSVQIAVGAMCAVGCMVALAYASGDWGATKDAVDHFKGSYDSLRRLTPEETRRLVTAVCDVDADERASVASDSADRVAREVSDKYDALQHERDDTLRKLDDVISDDNLRDQRSDAQGKRDDVRKWWDTIDRMTHALRGKNHPVIRFLVDEGNRAHRDRQGSSSYCTVAEFSMDSGRADCIDASSCTVIELKPDNPRAISKGKAQAAVYQTELNSKQATRTKLIEQNGAFTKCTKFEVRVDCYKVCPDIDDDTNEMKSTYASWRTNC